MMQDDDGGKLVEAIAKAIVAADEQNGGPPWDYIVGLGKHAIAARMDQAAAALSAIERKGYVIAKKDDVPNRLSWAAPPKQG